MMEPVVGKRSGAFRLFRPLRIRDFKLLWTGLVVSLIGDGMFLIALAWQVYELSNSPSALAIVGVSMSVSHVLFLLVGGVITDRLDRRIVMMGADVVRGTAVAALGILTLSGNIELWHIVALAAVYGAGNAFFGPAFDAIVPDVVPPDQLTQANAMDQLVRPAAWHMAGPAIGGVVVGVLGAGAAFLIDAGTFAVSIWALSLIKSRPSQQSEVRDGSLFGEVAEGFRYVRQRVWLWGTFLAATVAYLVFLGPIEVLLPFVVRNEMGGSATDLGFVLAVGGVGAIGVAMLIGARGIPRKNMTFIYITWTISTLAVAGYGLANVPWQAMIAAFIFGSFEAAGLIAWITTKHRLVPRHLLGRVSSLDWFISVGLLPVSYAMTVPVVEFLGPRSTLIGAGVLGAAATLAFLFLPGMRDPEELQEVGTEVELTIA